MINKHLAVMHKAFGTIAGKTCGECVHLVTHSRATTWFKCELTRPGGPTTDWRKTWQACGKFEAGAARKVYHA